MTQPAAPINLPSRTRIEQAHATIGCDIAQIVTSTVLPGRRSDSCILAMASGTSQTDENQTAAAIRRVARLIDEKPLPFDLVKIPAVIALT